MVKMEGGCSMINLNDINRAWICKMEKEIKEFFDNEAEHSGEDVEFVQNFVQHNEYEEYEG